MNTEARKQDPEFLPARPGTEPGGSAELDEAQLDQVGGGSIGLAVAASMAVIGFAAWNYNRFRRR